MAGQKIENLLNLALDATQEEREKSLELDVGYHPVDKVWDLIVKYSGSLDEIRQIAERVTELMNEYAIITVKESRINELAGLPQIEYVEKPKRLFFQVENGRRVSCIDAVQGARFSLFGQGVLTAVIDSGIDYTLADFRNPDGTTRIRSLWDQSLRARDGEMPPAGYELGVEYTQEQINEALRAQSMPERMRLVASRDSSGHGTAVAGIAAGNGRGGLIRQEAPEGEGMQTAGNLEDVYSPYAGAAPQSELLVVKLGNPMEEGFPRTTELMAGLDYVIRKALEYQMPVAVNISFGNTYGSHEPYN